MTSLYHIQREYVEAISFLESLEDVDQETINNTIEGLQFPVNEKVINLASHVKNLEINSYSVKIAIDELRDRYENLKKEEEKFRNSIYNLMENCKLKKVESPLFDVTSKENPGRLFINDGNKIPDKFSRVEVQRVTVFDNAAIKEAIKSGQEVPGACLVKDKKIVIK